MNLTRAYKLALEAIAAQMKTLAVDANLCDHYGAAYPQAVNASRKRAELKEAARILEEEEKRGKWIQSVI